jgi:hypothetical protein
MDALKLKKHALPFSKSFLKGVWGERCLLLSGLPETAVFSRRSKLEGRLRPAFSPKKFPHKIFRAFSHQNSSAVIGVSL